MGSGVFFCIYGSIGRAESLFVRGFGKKEALIFFFSWDTQEHGIVFWC